MVIKVGINGFGRIGRVIFRTCHQNPDLEVTAINDPAIDVEYICYLIRFDSTHGKFKGSIRHTQNEITVDDTKIKIFHDKLPSNVPWQSADVQYVVEASGIFTSYQKASGHLASEGVKRVIVTAPCADIPMVILGVNQNDLDTEKKVISSASSTLYCLAPIIKILNDNFGVSEGFLTSIHAMTPSLKPLDGLCLRGKHWRDHRSIHQNIIPAATGACKALGKIIPQVKDKLVGLAFRVPIVNVSVLDLTIRLNKETSLQEITNAVDAYSNTTMRNIVKISNEDAVSSDFAGDQHSCILDADSSLQLKKNFFKLVCWYENEFSYACRVIDLIMFSEKQFSLYDPRNKMTFVRTRPNRKLVESQDQDDELKNRICPSIDTSSQILHCKSQMRLRIRSPGRPLILRKPLSGKLSGNSQDTSKSDEVFRIWKDDNEKNKQVMVPSPTYHSCDEITLQNQMNNVKAQQRLENVKKEFSKMVSITESLLRKCSMVSDHLQESVSDENIKEKQSNCTDIIHSSKHNNADQSPPINQNSPVSDISGDYNSNIEDRTSSNNHFSADNFSDYNKNSSLYNIHTNLENSDTINPKSKCNIVDVARRSNIQTRSTTKKIVDNVFQDQVVKTITNLIDGLSQSIDLNLEDKQQNLNESDKLKDIGHNAYINESFENDDSGFVSPVKHRINPVSGDISKKISKTQLAVSCMELKGSKKFADSVTFEIKKHKTAMDEQPKKDSISNKFKTYNTDCFSAISIDNPKKSLDIPAEIYKFLAEPMIIKADNSKCASSVFNASGNGDNGRKIDIYDKLDSVSASDSDNSFQIHERKSQVINLSDLTNSIDDLVRLDKICRIMEISDELSDKLFSALSNSENPVMQKTKWSFKDLCQRIKLDEFCNKLFAAQSCHYDQKKIKNVEL